MSKVMVAGVCGALGLWAGTFRASAQTEWSLRDSGVFEVLSTVVHGTSGFVAAGDFGTVIRSTNGGVTWTPAVLPDEELEMTVRGSLFDGTRYVLCGQSALLGQVVTSTNGVTWTASTMTQQATNILLTSLARGNGTYIACGSNGRVFRTANPATWTTAPAVLAGSPLLQGAAFANNTFVVVGAAGYIAKSADGAAWTPVPSGTGLSLSAAAFGNGTWVFVGANGGIFTTTDLVTITPQASGTEEFLFGVTYAGGYFVAVGAGGMVLTSTDGAAWTPRATALTERIAAVAEGAATFVAVGEPTTGTGSAAVLTAAGNVSAGLRWSAPAATVSETAGSVALTVERLGPASTAVQVRCVLASGTATVGADLPDSSTVVTLAAGESSKTITLPITNDTLVEGAETFTAELRIETSGLALLLPSTVEVTIQDDEDSDDDGLADAWEQLHFQSLAAAAADDPDADGNSNLVEYQDGTLPKDPASVLYALNVVTEGNGTVSATPAGTPKFAKGTAVTLVATPAAGWVFKNWSGATIGAAAQTNLTVNGNSTVTATFSLVVPAAIDAEARTWTLAGTGGAWFGQGPVNHDGVDAAQAGACAAGESTSFSTVVDGPAKVTFWWKASCNFAGDALRFSMDGSVQTFITGQQDWVSQTFNMPSGRHTLAWTFARGANAPAGQDTAWVDTVRIEDELGQWLAKWFTEEEISNPAISGLDVDHDRDGLRNRMEFALDLNPKAPSQGSAALPRPEMVTVNGTPHLSLVYRRPSTRTVRLTFTLRTSTNLAAWTDVVTSEEIVSESGGIQTVRLTDPAPLSAARTKFARLRVADK